MSFEGGRWGAGGQKLVFWRIGVFPLILEIWLQEAAGPLWPCYGAALFLACRPGSRDVGLSLNGPHPSKPGPPAKNTPAG